MWQEVSTIVGVTSGKTSGGETIHSFMSEPRAQPKLRCWRLWECEEEDDEETKMQAKYLFTCKGDKYNGLEASVMISNSAVVLAFCQKNN